MQELEAAIQTAFKGMVATGQLAKIVETQVQRSVENVLNDTFRSGSVFQKALADHVQKAIGLDFSDLGLVGYNVVVRNIIKAKLDATINHFAIKQIEACLDEVLQNPPTEITLAELRDLLREHQRNHYREEREISCHVVMNENTCPGYGVLKMDVKPNVSAKECGFEIAFTDTGEIYRLGLPYQGNFDNRVFVGPFYGFERALFQMYVAKTKLVLNGEREVES